MGTRITLEDPVFESKLDAFDAAIAKWPTLPKKPRPDRAKEEIQAARNDVVAHVIELLAVGGSIVAEITEPLDDAEVLMKLAKYIDGTLDQSEGQWHPKYLAAKRAQASRFRELAKTMPRRCRHCGCTEDQACEGGCSWIHPNLNVCSRCGQMVAAAPAAAEVTG